jgi:hypothetical protein
VGWDERTTAAALVAVFEGYATEADRRIRVEDLLSDAAAAAGEACIAAAGEFDPERHDFTPGSVVMSDRINGILAGDTTDASAPSASGSVFAVIRAGALARGYAAADVPPLEDVFRGFAAGIAGPETPWGFVPLSVGADHRPRVQPLRAAYELRGPVRAVLAKGSVPTAEWPRALALALVDELARVRSAIEPRVALTLVYETINGMAKTAPMTDAALSNASR